VPRLNAALVVKDAALRRQIQEVLAQLDASVVLDRGEADWIEVLAEITRLQPQVVLAEVAAVPEPVERSFEALRLLPAPPVIVAVHATADPAAILKVLRAGASEFLYPPFEAGLRDAIDRLLRHRMQVRGGVRKKGRTLGFMSVKGGCGATTVACHTAMELAGRTKQKVLLADFDVDAGMVGFLMKAESQYSVSDAARNTHRLDQSFWSALVASAAPNLDVIVAPRAPAATDTPGGEAFRHVLRFVRAEYDWILVDLGRGLNAISLSALDDLDETYLVATPDLPALYRAKLLIRSLLDAGYGSRQGTAADDVQTTYASNRVRLVLNRVGGRSAVEPPDVDKMLGLPSYARLPDEWSSLYEAYAAGKLLPERSALRRAIAAMAGDIAGVREAKPARRFGLFGWKEATC
jgi:pilus assembly protein CpaE